MKIVITESQYRKIWKFIHEDTDVADDVGILSDRDKYIIYKREIEPQFKYLTNVANKYYYEDTDERDDLVQKTMIKAYQFLHQYKPETNVRAWLLTIMKNTFTNDYRKKKIEDKYTVRLDDNSNLGADDEDGDNDLPNTGYENTDFTYGDEMTSALEKLPEDWKDIFLMSYVEDMTYEEIADKYNIPIGTIRSRLFRIKEFLYNQLHKTSIGREKVKSDRKIKSVRDSDWEFGTPTIEKSTIYFPPKSLRPKINKIEKPVMNVPPPQVQRRLRKIENPVINEPIMSPVIKTPEVKPSVVKTPKVRTNEPRKKRKREFVSINDNISFDGYSYIVRMMVNRKKYQKTFDQLEDAVKYQDELLKVRNEAMKNKIRFDGNWYVVEMFIKGKRYWKRFKDKDEAIRYKEELMNLKNS